MNINIETQNFVRQDDVLVLLPVVAIEWAPGLFRLHVGWLAWGVTVEFGA